MLLQGGTALKMLATAARLDIEDFVGKEVFVEVCHHPIFKFCIQFTVLFYLVDMLEDVKPSAPTLILMYYHQYAY